MTNSSIYGSKAYRNTAVYLYLDWNNDWRRDYALSVVFAELSPGGANCRGIRAPYWIPFYNWEAI